MPPLKIDKWPCGVPCEDGTDTTRTFIHTILSLKMAGWRGCLGGDLLTNTQTDYLLFNGTVFEVK